MEQSRFTGSQILAILKQIEGNTGARIVPGTRISSATVYKWRSTGGMDASLMA